MLFTKKRFITSLLPLLINIGQCLSQTKLIPYQELPDASGAPTGSGMFFSANMNPSLLTIIFEGPADRWIALGFGSAMIPTDAFIYSCGHVMSVHSLGWQDYYNSSQNNSGVLVDAIQNWTVVSTNTLSNGQRTVTAMRALNTGDLNDTPISFSATALNLVWARGASPDYTIAFHGSNNRANGISLPWLSVPTASFATSASVCEGSPLTFTNLSTGGLTTYTWSFPGGSPATSTLSNPTVVYPSTGAYLVSLNASNALGTDSYSQTFNISVTPTTAVSITIQQITGSNPMCAGSAATFSSTVSNAGSFPTYQWKINGVNVDTVNPLIYSVSGSGLFTCEFTSGVPCALPKPVISAAIDLTVHSTEAASVTVGILNGTNPLCQGDTISFIATSSNGGTLPNYQWQINGSNVGINNATFNTSSLASNDVVKCILNSSAPCASITQASSSGITMTIHPIVVPKILIEHGVKDSILCKGTPITFTAVPMNGGPQPVYHWWVNGVDALVNSPTFMPTLSVGNNSVQCVLGSNLDCANPLSVSSNLLVLHLSECIGLFSFSSNSENSKVFPNPSTGLILIDSPNEDIQNVSVMDVSGRQVLNKITDKPGRKIYIDLGKEKSGIYLLELHYENHMVRKRISLIN